MIEIEAIWPQSICCKFEFPRRWIFPQLLQMLSRLGVKKKKKKGIFFVVVCLESHLLLSRHMARGRPKTDSANSVVVRSSIVCSAAAVDMNISTDDVVVCMCESTCYVYGCQLYFQLLISISMYGNCPIGSGVVVLFF